LNTLAPARTTRLINARRSFTAVQDDRPRDAVLPDKITLADYSG
jgi:hypothetical protein